MMTPNSLVRVTLTPHGRDTIEWDSDHIVCTLWVAMTILSPHMEAGNDLLFTTLEEV